jgi:hypothetical protein
LFVEVMAQGDDWQVQYDAAAKTAGEVSTLIGEKMAIEAQGSSAAKVKAQLRKKSNLLDFTMSIDIAIFSVESFKEQHYKLESQLKDIEARPEKYGV